MLTSDVRLWHSRKSRLRMLHADDPEPRSVQIAGGDPQMLAEAARANVELGAQIIDINMGCPAKKVCNKAAGSALMKDEKLVAEILSAVVGAVDVPVTLKIRTGWDRDNKNGLTVARIAEQEGIAALAVHGRTRADLYTGEAEYDTIATIKQAVSMPVFANGDITSPEKARQVLAHTGADALLIGRAAQGARGSSGRSTISWKPGNACPSRGCKKWNEYCWIICRHCTPFTATRWAFASPASMSAGIWQRCRAPGSSAPNSIVWTARTRSAPMFVNSSPRGMQRKRWPHDHDRDI